MVMVHNGYAQRASKATTRLTSNTRAICSPLTPGERGTLETWSGHRRENTLLPKRTGSRQLPWRACGMQRRTTTAAPFVDCRLIDASSSKGHTSPTIGCCRGYGRATLHKDARETSPGGRPPHPCTHPQRSHGCTKTRPPSLAGPAYLPGAASRAVSHQPATCPPPRG